MGRRLILDTSVLIALERGTLDITHVITSDDDAVIAAVTLTELRVGVRLAAEEHKEARQAAVDRVLRLFPVEDYTDSTSEAHAELLAHCYRTGTPRGALDLIIAATAVATGRSLVTTDAKLGLSDLPGVQLVQP